MNDNKTWKIEISMGQASVTGGGVFQGWGSSLCWWANRLGYSDTLAEKSAKLFYGEQGLRLNVMRYNIGGGDDPSHSHIARTDSAVPGWLVWDEKRQEYQYDYEADFNQLNVLERAYQAAGKDAYVEVFSNSAPYFMTISGCSSGAVNAAENNLKEECYDDFAAYLAHVSKYIQEELGIHISSVSPMNEPNTDYWQAFSPKQEGCHVEPGRDQSEILLKTARAFQDCGLTDVILAASDETSPDRQVLAYHSYSEEALKVIGRISTHTYLENGMEELGMLAKEKHFPLWMSEVDGGLTIGEDAGEMGAALWFGQKIISDLNTLSPSAWVMWQLIDNHISKDGYKGNQDSGMVDRNGGYWGVAVADHDREEILLTQKYYGMGQFTRYIRPGAQLIHCGEHVIAAYDREKKRLVLVAVNAKAQEQFCQVHWEEFYAGTGRVQVIRTSGSLEQGESWAVLPDIKGETHGFSAYLKGNSITTFVIDNVVKNK